MRKLCFLFLFVFFQPLTAQAVNDVYVIHLTLDGMRYDVVKKNLEQLNLPTLKKYFVDEGVFFENAYTVFPTVSTPAYISFVTGLGPADSGVPFLEWFDRSKKRSIGYLTWRGYLAMNRDFWNRRALLNPDNPEMNPPTTLFERLNGEETYALYTPFRRGAKRVFPRRIPVRATLNAFVTHNELALDRHAWKKILKKFSGPIEKTPRFTFVGLYSSDYIGHKQGTEAGYFAPLLVELDQSLQKLISLLQKKGILEKTYIVITSDHGMHPTGNFFALEKLFWSKGLRLKPDNPRVKDFDLYVSNRGVSSTFIYARGEEGWSDLPNEAWLRHFPTRRKSIDLIDFLLKQEPVDWVAARNGNGHVKIYTHDGREGTLKTFRINGQRFYSYSYSAEKGTDPFGYASDPSLKPLLNGEPFHFSVWGEKTAATERPDAVVQVADLFDDVRTGDILVVNKNGWTFRTEKKGSHGSLNQEDMHIPLLIHGPGLKSSDPKRFIRSLDLYPTYLSWFGLPFDPTESSGRDIIDRTQDPDCKKCTESQVLAKIEKIFSDHPSLEKMINEEEFIASIRKSVKNVPAIFEAAQAEEKFRHRTLQKIISLEKKQSGSFGWEKERLLERERSRLLRMQDVRKALEP